MDKVERFEIRLAGEGGQGLILAGLMLAEAAAVYDGKNAVQTQSYGPEARGGASKAEVIISDDVIDYPKVIAADLLLCMSQEACSKYVYDLKKTGMLLVDSVHVNRAPVSSAHLVPITKIAEDVTGRRITANIVALGVIVGLTDIVSQKAIEAAVRARAPKGTEALNLKALQAGLDYARSLRDQEEKGQV